MTISILRLRPGQKVARPFQRAVSVAEMAELLAYHLVYEQMQDLNNPAKAMRLAKAAGETAHRDPKSFLNVNNLDTEEPVKVGSTRDSQGCLIGGVKFYAFTEE